MLDCSRHQNRYRLTHIWHCQLPLMSSCQKKKSLRNGTHPRHPLPAPPTTKNIRNKRNQSTVENQDEDRESATRSDENLINLIDIILSNPDRQLKAPSQESVAQEADLVIKVIVRVGISN